jgi:hypothetical protein
VNKTHGNTQIIRCSATRHGGAWGERRYSSYLYLTSATRWGWVVSVTPQPRFTPGERIPGTHWIGGWVGPRAGLDAGPRRNTHLIEVQNISMRFKVLTALKMSVLVFWVVRVDLQLNVISNHTHIGVWYFYIHEVWEREGMHRNPHWIIYMVLCLKPFTQKSLSLDIKAPCLGWPPVPPFAGQSWKLTSNPVSHILHEMSCKFPFS